MDSITIVLPPSSLISHCPRFPVFFFFSPAVCVSNPFTFFFLPFLFLLEHFTAIYIVASFLLCFGCALPLPLRISTFPQSLSLYSSTPPFRIVLRTASLSAFVCLLHCPLVVLSAYASHFGAFQPVHTLLKNCFTVYFSVFSSHRHICIIEHPTTYQLNYQSINHQPTTYSRRTAVVSCSYRLSL